MEDRKNFNKRYIFVSAVLLALSIWYLILPKPFHTRELNPEQLLTEVLSNARYISSDQLSAEIISGMSITLVDLRTQSEFSIYHLPGALNIPSSDIFLEDDNGKMKWEHVFSNEDSKIVLYGNGSVQAIQTWTLLKRLKYQNITVLEGGLNGWFKTIFLAKTPGPCASEAERTRHEIRQSSKLFFTGHAPAAKTPDGLEKLKPKKTESKHQSGGC